MKSSLRRTAWLASRYRLDAQVRPDVKQLGLSPQAAGSHHRARRQTVERLHGRIAKDEHVADGSPLGHGRQRQPLHGLGRQILQAVHGQIDSILAERTLNLLGKDTPGPDFVDRALPLTIPGRGYRDKLDLGAVLHETARHPVGLPKGQPTGTCSES